VVPVVVGFIGLLAGSTAVELVAHGQCPVAVVRSCDQWSRSGPVVVGLREEAELYLQWSVSFGREPDRDLPGEHRALLDAVVAREADRAAELLRDHLAHAAQLLISVATDEPNEIVVEQVSSVGPNH
jgi:nucleotide-binding universal stress UspA family protein